MKSARPSPNYIYKIHDPLGLKLLTRLRPGLSHLIEQRFYRSYDSCINPLCSCSAEVELTRHFFLLCHNYCNIHKTLLNTVEMICKIMMI